jgi:hypothetical protein
VIREHINPQSWYIRGSALEAPFLCLLGEIIIYRASPSEEPNEQCLSLVSTSLTGGAVGSHLTSGVLAGEWDHSKTCFTRVWWGKMRQSQAKHLRSRLGIASTKLLFPLTIITTSSWEGQWGPAHGPGLGPDQGEMGSSITSSIQLINYPCTPDKCKHAARKRRHGIP